ncbi:MAG: DUF998 domain-containing protein [Microbacteriaceae bacterium]
MSGITEPGSPETDSDEPASNADAVRVESRAVYAAAGAFIVCGLTAFAVFHGTLTVLWGNWSVGFLAIIVGSVCGAIAFGLGSKNSYRRPNSPKRVRTSIIMRSLDTAALIFTHVAIYSMLCYVLFAVFQDAFKGLRVDALTSTMLVGLMGAVSSYFMYLSASTITSYKLSSLLVIFVTSGVLVSMVTARDPHWWQMNFSALGMTRDFSGYAFNGTLIIAGAVITTLANYITSDLRALAHIREAAQPQRVVILRVALVLIGVCVATIGLVPVSTSVIIHNTASSSLALVFFSLVIGLRFLIPGFPKAFFLLSYVLLGVVTISALLFFPIGYYNLTAFELIVSSLIFGWLAILIRNIAAISEDRRVGTAYTSQPDSMPPAAGKHRESRMARNSAFLRGHAGGRVR